MSPRASPSDGALEVLAGLTHKLGSPLGSIVNYTYLLTSELAGRLTPPERDWLEKVGRAVGDARGLLETTSQFLDAAREDWRPESVALGPWIASGLGDDGEVARRVVTSAEVLPPTLRAHVDPRSLDVAGRSLRSLWHLLTPADDPPRVRIRAEVLEGEVSVTMELGNPAETVGSEERWCRPFHPIGRGSATPPHLGLHVAILRTVLERQGGGLDCAASGRGNPSWTLRMQVGAPCEESALPA